MTAALARVLELPATGWLRRYRVRAHGRITQNELDRLREGITIDGVRYGPIEATLDRGQGSNTWLTFAIREGKNREVKNVLGHLGLAVNRLIRMSFGPFQLGDLVPGEIEEVRTRTLRDQLGTRIAALLEADFSGPVGPKNRTIGAIYLPLSGEVGDPKAGEPGGGHALRSYRIEGYPHPTAVRFAREANAVDLPLRGRYTEPDRLARRRPGKGCGGTVPEREARRGFGPRRRAGTGTTREAPRAPAARRKRR